MGAGGRPQGSRLRGRGGLVLIGAICVGGGGLCLRRNKGAITLTQPSPRTGEGETVTEEGSSRIAPTREGRVGSDGSDLCGQGVGSCLRRNKGEITLTQPSPRTGEGKTVTEEGSSRIAPTRGEEWEGFWITGLAGVTGVGADHLPPVRDWLLPKRVSMP